MTELEQQQHKAICGMLDGFKSIGYLNLAKMLQEDYTEILRAVIILEAAARAGGGDYCDM